MKGRVKIRGIYSTALTRFLLDSGFDIADPSPEIQERFGIPQNHRSPGILMKDSEDHQGIEMVGESEGICRLVADLQPQLFDMAMLYFEALPDSDKDLFSEIEPTREVSHARLEFGAESKKMLDLFRSAVVPSAALHHRLRIINPKKLEKAEEEIQARPRRKEQIEKRVFKEAVLEPLGKAESLRLDHIKISGKPVHLREGALLETKGSRVRIKRSFTQGRYDGLRLPIEAGDYSVTEFEEGAWHVKHAYYSRDGRLKGEYYNINTPVELYPFGGRYLDLEIDVVRRAGEQPLLVDREDLAALARNGKISPRLEERALQVADGLVEELKES